MNVLFVGELPDKAAPSLTLATVLGSFGFSTKFSEEAELKAPGLWAELLFWADVIIVVDYTGPGTFRLRQLARAAILGKPIIRWWVGSDVLHVLEEPRWQTGAKTLNCFTFTNIVVAPHLVEELASINISCSYIPSVILPVPTEAEVLDNVPPNAVLIYLPSNRLDFYGVNVCEEMIKEYPEVKFKIVGDDSHSLAGYANVDSLGWVSMDDVWQTIGALLRITQHDGMPRMVLEALSRGKYVIYSWPLSGCWQATAKAEVKEKLESFLQKTGPNRQGIEAVRQLMAEKPEQAFVGMILNALNRRNMWLRIRAVLIYLKLSGTVFIWALKSKYTAKRFSS